MKIVVVIPAKDEKDSIRGIIRQLQDVNRKEKLGSMQILVVDDSRDNTGEIAVNAGAKVVRGESKGLGAAMYLGIKKATDLNPDIIVSIDADGQFDPAELPRVVKPIIQGKADMVLGSRFLEPGLVTYRMSMSHKFGNNLLSWFVRRVTKENITDAQTGFRAMKIEVAKSLEMIGTHTYVQETIIDAVNKRFRVMEVPVHFNKRGHGDSKVVSSIKRYAIWSLPTLVLRAGLHMMLFTTLGALFFIAGAVYGAYLFYIENFNPLRVGLHEPALLLVTLLLSSGLQMFFFGFLLNIIMEMKNKVDKLRS